MLRAPAAKAGVVVPQAHSFGRKLRGHGALVSTYFNIRQANENLANENLAVALLTRASTLRGSKPGLSKPGLMSQRAPRLQIMSRAPTGRTERTRRHPQPRRCVRLRPAGALGGTSE